MNHLTQSYSRYTSSFEYLSDFQVVVEPWKPNPNLYDKSFYGVVPSNTQTVSYSPVVAEYEDEYTRLAQTDVMDQMERFPNSTLSKTIQLVTDKMGTIHTTTGTNIGTCTLIANNLVMVARHTIEGSFLPDLKVTFGYCKGGASKLSQTLFDHVIEDSLVLDYAIVALKHPVGEKLGYVKWNRKADLLSEPALFHYPLGSPLKVSVHTFDQVDHSSNYLRTFHDSDHLSSGGAYFDLKGCWVAMHLGSQLEGDRHHLSRYALTIEKIMTSNPKSMLTQFADGLKSQARSYAAHIPTYWLGVGLHAFLMDVEGRKSKAILTELFKEEINRSNQRYDQDIEYDASGVIFSSENLDYLKTNYPQKFKKLINECLYQSGDHGITHLFSVTGYIESDHTLPYSVWESTTNQKMRKQFKKGGENGLPAITIPFNKHRSLLTTGNSAATQAFRASLVKLCDQDKIDEALIKCFQEYVVKGVTVPKETIEDTLISYKDLGLITAAQIKQILKTLKL